MVDMREQTSKDQKRVTPFTDKIERLYIAIHLRQYGINNMVQVFRDDEQINEVQCQEAAARLQGLRVATRSAHQWISAMHPSNSEILTPYGTTAQLEALETSIRETCLLVTVFGKTCQKMSLDRVEMQLSLIESMLQTKRLLHNCIETFGALVTLAEEMEVSCER